MNRSHRLLLALLLMLPAALCAQESEHGVHQITFQFNRVDFQFSLMPVDSVWHTALDGSQFVTLNGYYVGTTEVTRRQYDAIMQHSWSWPDIGDNADSLPATGLTRTQWQEFMDSLNSRYIMQLRFPTREEWEECYHGGPLSQGYKYSGSDRRQWVAQPEGTIHPVAQLIPNELELFDMEGNAIEYYNDAPFNVRPNNDELPSYGMRLVFNSSINVSKKE